MAKTSDKKKVNTKPAPKKSTGTKNNKNKAVPKEPPKKYIWD